MRRPLIIVTMATMATTAIVTTTTHHLHHTPVAVPTIRRTMNTLLRHLVVSILTQLNSLLHQQELQLWRRQSSHMPAHLRIRQPMLQFPHTTLRTTLNSLGHTMPMDIHPPKQVTM